jgi:hypothetical protein
MQDLSLQFKNELTDDKIFDDSNLSVFLFFESGLYMLCISVSLICVAVFLSFCAFLDGELILALFRWGLIIPFSSIVDFGS